mmetsp:Transcript_56475/g.82869  ORF Transcript_56475/g.82869 Transcript_56475/m.82869 type:complete len:123 (-) Transcript_56475:302-670(-)
MAAMQAERGQEALQIFLSSWQDALVHMATPHQNMAVAAQQLKALRQTFSFHLEELETASRGVDEATAHPVAEKAASASIVATRAALKTKLQEKQAQLKMTIDKLRGMQNDVTLLTCATVTYD